MESAGHVVEVVLDDREPQLPDVEAGAFGEPSAQQRVGVLVGGSLPRRARLAEEHLDAERGLDVGPAGHLAALVPGEAAHERAGLAAQRRGDRRGDGRRAVAVGQRRGDRRGDGRRAVAVGQRCGDRVAAGALGERDRSGEVRFADDEVAFPVAGFCERSSTSAGRSANRRYSPSGLSLWACATQRGRRRRQRRGSFAQEPAGKPLRASFA